MSDKATSDRQGASLEPSAEVGLQRVDRLARELGAERVSEQAAELAGRLADGRFYVACVGQFKRGKSTLIGALVGERILPTGVLPITTVPTVVRYGPAKNARIRFIDGNWMNIEIGQLAQYVSEEHNSENKKGVTAVEVFVPNALLAGGLCFVDTPGIGSVFAANTSATKAFIPHIDAAIVVVGSDPPISGEERAIVDELGKHIHEMLVVVNKADRATKAERETAKSFTEDVLRDTLRRDIGAIYEVSAEDRLAGSGPDRDWWRLVDALRTLTQSSGHDLVRTAGERGIRRLTDELLTAVSEETAALTRPIEESERRIANLRQMVLDAEESLRDVGELLSAEERRLSEVFVDDRKRFLATAKPEAEVRFAQGISQLGRGFGPKYRRETMCIAQSVCEREIVLWLQVEQRRAEEKYRGVTTRFVQIGKDFLKRLSESEVPEFARLPDALDVENKFTARSRFQFEALIVVARPASPLRYVADVLLGIIRAHRFIERNTKEFLEHLMDLNSARIQSDVMDRVRQSRGQLEVEIRKVLHEVSRIAERALERARRVRDEGAKAIEERLSRLDAIEEELRSINLPLRTERT